MLNLSICVIGKNEAKNLPNMIKSLQMFENSPLALETIYVDSASSDASVEIAKDFFSKTVVLADSPNLCAAAGRYSGTISASGEWILYLDADMTLQREFFDFINEICLESPEDLGWVGRCDFLFDDGTSALNIGPKRTDNQIAPSFGGAVLLSRQAVLHTGNWAAGVFSKEEFELYSRLREIGYRVIFRDIGMVFHYAPKQSVLQSIRSQFFPAGGLGKKFYGFGQLVHHRIRQRSLVSYMKYNPYPFVWIFSMLALVVFTILGLPIFAALLFGAGFLYISLKKGIKGTLSLSGLLVQGVLGFFRYDPDYKPSTERTYSGTNF